MRPYRLAAAALLALAACHRAPDPRLDGEWEIHLSVTQSSWPSKRSQVPGADSITGVVYLSSKFPEAIPLPREMRSRALGMYFIDFGPLFGRPPQGGTIPPAEDLDLGSLQQLLAGIVRGDSVSIQLDPYVDDAGYGLGGRIHGDTIVGTWDQYTIGGRGATGGFRMWRRPPSPRLDSAVAHAKRYVDRLDSADDGPASATQPADTNPSSR